MATSPNPALAPEVHTLEDLFRFRQPEEVQEFLQSNPFLVPLLYEGHDKIGECFPSSPIFLQVIHDPEDADNLQLVAFIGTESAPAQAFMQLQRLDADWWLNALDQAQGKLQITVEFR